jgi:hypothetical protein
VAEGVVGFGEVVEVDQADGGVAAFAAARLSSIFDQAGAVGQAGEPS